MLQTADNRKRVAIVGGGAAGMSAAYALSLCPGKFEVVLFERSSSPGGMATSIPINAKKYGASYINDGVQGGSPVFGNTYSMFEKLGCTPSDVGFQISFGREVGEDYWSNVFPAALLDQHKDSINKFSTFLKVTSNPVLEPVFGLMPIHLSLTLFRFPKAFAEALVFPLVALFMGTGNQTPYVSTAIVERLFTDKSMRLFDYSKESFVNGIPEMRAFPCLGEVYRRWKKEVESRGNVEVRLQVEVTGMQRSVKYVNQSNGQRREGVKIYSSATLGTNSDQEIEGYAGAETEEMFSDVIIACDADAALKVLGKDASWMEKKVLGNVKYLWDITVTHNDLGYLEKYYRVRFSDDLPSKKRLAEGDEETKKAVEFAKDNFKPLYYVRSYPEDKKKIEMSFDLTNYQPQFKGESPFGPVTMSDSATDDDQANDGRAASAPDARRSTHAESLADGELPPLEDHVFQTIFLDKDGSGGMWTKGEIDKEKVIGEKWWKQQSHRWQHYAGTVPWMMFLNGKRHTYFAGAWTILNMHEIAVCSGLGAAYRLGAPYPFTDKPEELCGRLFKLTLGVNHGVRVRKEDRDGFIA
ncbi:FAD/NAD(P)-binding domain-containing protein [Pleurotus eryngii]|uniref:FAD/NAD(P)-binding domain-containing protein n=1 Tax=Pleurotus eryngii TaxID=5323 RepID=A0A9P6AB51_PLEER|nr:FAD/NAD(P)-binding domain-containing protein [Pleurotus eryngii]